MPRLLKKLRARLSTTAANKDNEVHVSVQADPPPVPNASPPSPKPPTTTEPVIEPQPLQGRLWNEAYELLKLSNAELVESYEKILSRELLRGRQDVSEAASLENRIDATYDKRWKQMHLIVDTALERQEARVARKQKIGGGLAAVNIAMGQAVRTVPEAAVAWTGVCFAFEMASNSVQEAKANHAGMTYVVSRMEWYWHLAELLLDDNKSEAAPSTLRSEMEKHIVDLYRKLLLYQMKSVCRFYRRYGSALWRDAIKADDWVGQLDEIRSAEATIQEDSRVFNALAIQRRLKEIDRGSQVLQREIQGVWSQIQEHILSKEAEKCLQDLRVTDPRDDKSRIEDTNGGLLQGAYDWAIKHNDFISWRDEKENHLLWIKGDPGKGKTMLLCGIIEELQSRGSQPCYFFCQATDPRLNSATAVLRGLIYLLMDTNRQLLSLIQEKYDQAGPGLFQDANSWVVLSQLFTELLEDPSLEGQVFMIDALDECQTDLGRLLNLIVGKSANRHARWIVSSRNWTSIEERLGVFSQKIRFSLELNEQSVSEAVNLYVSHKAAQLRTAKGLDVDMEQKVRKFLTDNARGTFLWVALVCKELLKLGVRKRHLLKKMTEFPSDLEQLYKRMMQQIRDSEDSDLCEKILRLVAVVYRPVTLAELAALLDIEGDLSGNDLEEIVASCGSFLVVRDDVVRFVHQSAQDFLLKDKAFAAGLGSQHYSLFSRSLEILTVTLRRDMYNLRHPGALIEEHALSQDQDVLKHAKYSCIYWVDHLRVINDLEREKCILCLQDDGIVHRFLAKKLLNWLEACSLIKRMSDATRTVSVLRKLAPVNECTMRSIIEDTHRFVLYHKVGVERAPLQVYISAIIFSPKSSLIRQLYEGTEGPNWIITKPDMPPEWSARLQYLERHTNSVNALTFSPDGTQLASGDCGRIATIWDTETGTCLQTFSCQGLIVDMVFSPDGRYLAIGSVAGVEVWDAMSMTSNLYTFYHECAMTEVTFSPDSAQLSATLFSLKIDDFIRIWDIRTGMEVKTHNLRTLSCKATAFAPDGTHLAFVADQEGTRYIWNTTTNKHLPLLGNGKCGCSRADRDATFSPDASSLAIATWDHICIFGASTGECLQDFFHRSSVYKSLRFLADSKRLMSLSIDRSISIFDTTAGTCLRQLNRTGRPDRSLAVPSPDGMLIAEVNRGSKRMGIEIWDMSANQPSGTSEESTEDVTAIALSPDAAQMATASIQVSSLDAKMIKIRDTLTGACLTEFPWSGEPIHSLAFFPDSKRLASGGEDHIQIWDTTTGLTVQTIELESRHVAIVGNRLVPPTTSSVAISSNGDLIGASFTYGQGAAIWDLTSSEMLLRFHLRRSINAEGPVAAAFSPDDARLGLVAESGSVYICDVNTGGVQKVESYFEPLDTFEPSSLQVRNELQLVNGQSEDNDQSPKQVQPRIFDMSGFKTSPDGTWILKGHRRVLWLPPDYRPSKVVSQDGVVVIRSRIGQTLLFRFAVEELDTLLS